MPNDLNFGQSVGVGAAASAADTAVGAALNQAFANRNAKLQYKYWKKMFDYQSEYNSPKNQLSRLYDAGINPLYNSEYGGSQSFSGNIGSLPSELPNSAFERSFSDAFSNIQSQSQSALNDSSTQLNSALADKARADAKKAGADAVGQEITNQFQAEKVLADIRALLSKSNKDDADRDKAIADTQQVSTYARAALNTSLANLRTAFANFQNSVTNSWKAAKDYEVNLFNASTDRMNAVTNRENFKVSAYRAENEVKQGYQRLKLDYNKFGWQKVQDVINSATSSVFGMKNISASTLNMYLGYGDFLSEQLQVESNHFNPKKNWITATQDFGGLVGSTLDFVGAFDRATKAFLDFKFPWLSKSKKSSLSNPTQ